ncbi:MAG: MBL fold metallo-hydrolase [Gammaproteobacteria bacterium]|nr:MBL fold metallo-hydrolase [Gammaproteobacteria bacterium]
MSNDKPYRIHTMELGPMENFVYLIEDIVTRTAAVVDPAWEVSKVNAKAKSLGLKITDILLTHSHFDHINGIGDVHKEFDAQVHLLKEEAKFWGEYQDTPTTHHGGDMIQLGKTEISVLHTPGHTPGSACYRLGDDLITGDTLFVFGCGRCDLEGGDPHVMYQTLKKLGGSMPAHTCIHPGHNYSDRETSRMQDELDGNPFMHFDDEKDFVEYRMVKHDKIRNAPYLPVPRKS